MMKFQFFNKGRFNGIYTIDKSNNLGFIKTFINTKFNKRGFGKKMKFSQITSSI